MNDAPTSAPEAPLSGRSAIVTGGSRGIGRAIAEELGRLGASVAVNYRQDRASADEAVTTIQEHGSDAVAISAAMGDPVDVDRLADQALEAFGHVDIVVNNAGIASRGLGIAETEPAELERLMGVHTFSSHRLASRLIPQMRERERGDFVMISSSEVPENRAGGAPYSMAKSALEALALTLAHEEVDHGIRANIVAPGLVVTDMGARLVQATVGLDDASQLDAQQHFGRVTRPADVAAVVGFLVGPGGEMVTGQRITVDGGATSSPLD